MTRRRCGRGFLLLGPDGRKITDATCIERIRALAIPPAWTDVWICPWPNGHIQATGTDAAGRRQYRYHAVWRARKDEEKFERAVRFGRALPVLRDVVRTDLTRSGPTRRRMLALGVRLLDRAFFRVGGEEYAEEHDTFGVATLQRRHATVSGDVVLFDYKAKGSVRRRVEVEDPEVARAVRSLLRRDRRRTDDLLAWRAAGGWHDVRSTHLNAYIKEALGDEFSAKDFRTWSATVLACAELSAAGATPRSAREAKRVKLGALEEVARALGNTPTVCRSSYVDPRVFDRFDAGETAVSGRPSLVSTRHQRARRKLEEAVLAMLDPALAA